MLAFSFSRPVMCSIDVIRSSAMRWFSVENG
nr:MAG TPA: hypothetical protein [Caudoviricetes sp.]